MVSADEAGEGGAWDVGALGDVGEVVTAEREDVVPGGGREAMPLRSCHVDHSTKRLLTLASVSNRNVEVLLPTGNRRVGPPNDSHVRSATLVNVSGRFFTLGVE